MTNERINRIQERKFLAKFIFVLIFVYVCLFEFILNVNRILPKPSLLLESFISIWKDYDLFFALIITTSAIYLSIIAGYLILYLLKNFLCRINYTFPSILYASKTFKYFPAFFYAVLFEYWFQGSYFAEFFFAILAITAMLASSYFEQIKNVKENYLHFAAGLKLPEKTIFSKIIWNSVRPSILISLRRFNFYMWVLILLFEFIANVEGLGRVYNQMLAYKDLSGIIALALIMAVIIYLTNKVMHYIYVKMIHWKDE